MLCIDQKTLCSHVNSVSLKLNQNLPPIKKTQKKTQKGRMHNTNERENTRTATENHTTTNEQTQPNRTGTKNRGRGHKFERGEGIQNEKNTQGRKGDAKDKQATTE